MSSNTDLGAIFEGDINILAGSDTADFGNGDLSVARNVSIDGTTASTSPTSGALVVSGGAGVAGNLYVDGITNLDQTNIDTTDGVFSVTGSNNVSFDVTAGISLDADAASNFNTSVGNLTVDSEAGTLVLDGHTGITADSATGGMSIDVAAASNFTTTSGAITVEATAASGGRVIVDGADSGAQAITLTASNAAGGIDLNAGTNGITADSTGAISLDAAAASNFTVATDAGGEDLTIAVTGATDSSVILSSTGTNANDAILLTTSAGGVSVSSNQNVIVDAGGQVDINSSASTINIGNDDVDQNINIGTQGERTVAIGNGVGAAGVTIDAGTGGVSIDAAAASNFTTSAGAITVNSAAALDMDAVDAVTIDSSSAGVSIDAAAASNFTTSAGVLTLDGNGGVNIAGNAAEVDITTTGTVDINSGPLDIDATGGAGNAAVTLDTDDTTNGIAIGTGVSGVPISIGHTTSEVTINDNLTVTGDLTVNGTTTTVDTETLTVEDTIILVNSGPSQLGEDVGLAAKRYQNHNTAGTGDVVSDSSTFQLTGTATISDASGAVVGSGTLFTTELQVNNLITIDGQTKKVTAITDATNLTVASAYTTSKAGELITSGHDSANHNGSGDTGTAQAGGSATTIILNDAASTVDDFYNGWWIHITAGTASGDVRRIKDYVGSTQTATIYSSADEVATPVSPVQGADFTASPDATSVYSLYRCPYILSAYDESADEWFFGCSGDDPATSGAVTITEYLNIHAGSADLNGTLTVDIINEHSSNHGVLIDGVLIKDGTITGTISGTSEVVNLTDNLTGTANRVALTSADTRGVFLILVQSQAVDGATAMFACASNAAGESGQVQRIVHDRGDDNENIRMTWQTSEQPALYYQTGHTGGSGASIPYDISITRVG